MSRKIYFPASLLPLILLFAFPGKAFSQNPAAGNNTGIEAAAAQIAALEKKENEIEQKVVKKIYEIKASIDSYNNSEKSLKGPTGLGRIEQMELKAERYSIERQARKLFEKEVLELIDLLKIWNEQKNQITEDKKYLELKQKILSLETSVSQEKVTVTLQDKKNIEYYEVKKEATLKEISALPDVYGNPSSWKHLYEANKEKIKDPAKPVPVGTVLIVPNVKSSSDFEDLE
ncbi:MAG: hypothetical protein A2017_09715 [Lentisphaerae bacterium GWF2_44_16]|nr:MAG: hypothetical protein A2017_09715 [Lentisphaerae bacterium GWF2_44_16]